jgi:hypothetical protein
MYLDTASRMSTVWDSSEDAATQVWWYRAPGREKEYQTVNKKQ